MKRVRVYKDTAWLAFVWRWACPNCNAQAGAKNRRVAFDAAFRHAQACPGHP